VVQKVWEAVGSRVRLAVDGNRGMTTRDAIRLSQTCRDIPYRGGLRAPRCHREPKTV